VIDVSASGQIGIPTPENVFYRLATLSESELGRVLRPQREVPFRGDQRFDRESVMLRVALDVALDRLTVLEVRLETGSDQVAPPTSDALFQLLRSDAFVRYVNSYLSFGVRLMAARLLGPDDRTGFALPYPPPLAPNVSVVATVDQRRRLFDDEDVANAIDFLDDFIPADALPSTTLSAGYPWDFADAHHWRFEDDGEWVSDYQRWLGGASYRPERADYFKRLTAGLVRLVRGLVDMYVDVEGRGSVDAARVSGRLFTYSAKIPYTARLGLLDLYVIARLFRADVSVAAVVSYPKPSWLELLRECVRRDGGDWWEIDEAIPILRAVLEVTCELVQNSGAIMADARDRALERLQFPRWPPETVTWPQAYEEELSEIARQRRRRGFVADSFEPRVETRVTARPASHYGWSRRVRTGEHLDNLVGLAFSGGGIRSATFNLGVLQRLQEIDLLRAVDYLSTVSGGSYIGAWLIANAFRSAGWLGQFTDWRPAVEHLRRYSNYLAPQRLTTIDSWTMWAGWLQNALWTQLLAVTWLVALLIMARLNAVLFAWNGWSSVAAHGNLVAVPLIASSVLLTMWTLRRAREHVAEWHVMAYVVVPVILGGYVCAAVLWAGRPGVPLLYSEVMRTAWVQWLPALFSLFLGIWLVSVASADTPWWQALVLGAVPAVLSSIVVYSALCFTMWMFGQWGSESRYAALAYIAGPAVIIFSIVAAMVVMVGLLGPSAQRWRREFWMRSELWITLFGLQNFALSFVAILGPLLVLSEFDRSWEVLQWALVIGWFGALFGGTLTSIVTSLFDGGSAGATGSKRRLDPATVRGVSSVMAWVFVAGGVLFTATALHVVMVALFTDHQIVASLYWLQLASLQPSNYWVAFVVLVAIGLLLSWRFDINVIGPIEVYRDCLVRCYLGASRAASGERRPSNFTGFDPEDDLPLWSVCHADSERPARYVGPFPIVNAAVDLGGGFGVGVHSRDSASFVLTPLRAGADRRAIGYAPVRRGRWSYAGGIDLGQAMAISGAAVSPKMGYRISSFAALLQAMFNVRLAWWMPSPGRALWAARAVPLGVLYLWREAFARGSEQGLFVNVSDGGHFENLGLYELVRRRCSVIIVSDAECDPELTFASLSNAIRLCAIDFNAIIDIDVDSIRGARESGLSQTHSTVGTITYSNGARGYLLYLKSSLTGDEDVTVKEYRASSRDFPHESTTDQFFDQAQFESYRRLGYHIAEQTFRGVEREATVTGMVDKLYRSLTAR
jgi:Patatin-like phospholipase